LKNKENNSF